MLAIIPEKRKDGLSSFSDLIKYNSREKKKEKSNDVLRTKRDNEFRRIFGIIEDNIRESENYFTRIRADSWIDADAIRIHLRSIADDLRAYRGGNGIGERSSSAVTSFRIESESDAESESDQSKYSGSQPGSRPRPEQSGGGTEQWDATELGRLGAGTGAVDARSGKNEQSSTSGQSSPRSGGLKRWDSEQLGGRILNATERNHRSQLAFIEKNLRAADFYIANFSEIDRDFEQRARANRASLSRAIITYNNRDRGNAGTSGLGFSDTREIVNDVAIQHNGLSFETLADEMKAVADQNVRVKDAVYHVIISWQSHEDPSDDVMFESAQHAIKALGMDGHQYLAAIHRDTDNAHLHLAVNRVHPDTFNAVYPHRDYYKLDYAMRELEIKYGFNHDNGPYSVYDVDGKKIVDWTNKSKPKKKSKKPQKASDMEAHTDYESFYSYLSEYVRPELAELLKHKTNWQDLHRFLAKYKVELKPKGQGFAFYSIGELEVTPVKASSIHVNLSKAKLEKRLGQHEPWLNQINQEVQGSIEYDKKRYRTKNPEERLKRKLERAEARKKLYEEYNLYVKQYKKIGLKQVDIKNRFAQITYEARQQRENVKNGNLNTAQRKAMYSVIAMQTLQRKEALKRQIESERQKIKIHNEKLKTFRQWVEEKAADGDAAAVSQLRGWRYKEQRKNNTVNSFMAGDQNTPFILQNVPYQVLRDGRVQYLHGKDVMFTDGGIQITLESKFDRNKDVVRNAHLLAINRFGNTVQITGEQDFKTLVTELKERKSQDKNRLK
ncbi:hypothetical protein L292_0558 [Acinetobacter junii CIP 107470 = MTCC 11364]|uniref:Uncharacterized protein n=1 Tax=Acinetobacter junii CIP 107470 = MTCC 11364 TaxID=1217666 RepID=S7WIW6_ACIJU|nr:TraI/MobA(P) family conjugative relaxase [Acinetobacter junii]ENV52056.1 hypothetical protein F953_00546 [Acinetobacter junii CIP 107470 = MTCC 11364]EPR83080.1 hypothetical protein L292_0558 [Acinetobacter junii CIP 107470 = MTCC 11364]